MERNFINFNGSLINTRYIKKIYKTESNYRLPNKEFYYEIRVNVDGTPGTHVETYRNEKDRDGRFSVLEEILTINYQ